MLPMAPKDISPYLRAWYKWKALRLPWRRQFLVGLDLYGNTFWEFRDPGSKAATEESGQWRRIVRYPRNTHYGDVKVSPPWHQWLRHTRKEPPSIEEQRADVARQARMKVLAAQADARWEAKAGVMDAPPSRQQQPSLADRIRQHEEQQPLSTSEPAVADIPPREQATSSEPGPDTSPSRDETWRKMQQQQQPKPAGKPGPWKQVRGGPSEEWQPKAWQRPAGPRKP
ncbi:hypothetical protein B0H63DRAFT_482434 [Podospora didyma]|uniref:NADH dehydrogenase [ubiquinone] 1 alpha subcomplex subunit n=1 Tax=Podospora didyma TaxID=330526 RepID=A0AAE0N9P9_9PEZI|nr:hypothetical protein B0H63DRAFT_482434 [Podospora didyma]